MLMGGVGVGAIFESTTRFDFVTVTAPLPPAAEDLLTEAGLDPAQTPEAVIDALIEAD